MTLQQQAYGLIDRLPDDSVQVIIQVMRRMLPRDKDMVKTTVQSSHEIALSRRMNASNHDETFVPSTPVWAANFSMKLSN